MNWSLFIYFVAFLMILVSALLIYRIGQIEGEGRRMRLSLSLSWNQQKTKITTSYKDDYLKKLFERAGNPLGLNDVRFKLIRTLYLFVQMIVIHFTWFLYGGPYPLGRLAGAAFIYVLLTPREGFLVEKALEVIAERRNNKKNREVYMLYSLLLNEFSIADKPYNLYAILTKFRDYFPLLRSAFDKARILYNRSPKMAMEAFSREIGTREARELSDILIDVDRLAPKKAYEILQNRYDDFNSFRIENYRRRMKDRGLIGYLIIFIPALSIVVNFGYPYYLEYKDLINISNNPMF